MAASGRRRTLATQHVSAAITLLVGLPWFLISLGIVAVVGLLLPGDARFLVWLFVLSGPVALLPQVEPLLARRLYRLQRPGREEERDRLSEHARAAAAGTGLSRSTFSLWVEQSDAPNASVTSGRFVVVTTAAMRLADQRLTAVLAHELAHHLGRHATVALLTQWYAVPARIVVRLIRTVLCASLGYTRRSAVGLVLPLAALVVYGSLLLTAAVTADLVLLAVLLLPTIGPVLLAWQSRRSELFADRVAVDVGLARPLEAALQQFLADEVDDRRGRRTRLLAMHPPLAERIAALHRYEDRQRSRA